MRVNDMEPTEKPGKIAFNEANEKRFQKLLPHYPNREAAMIPALHLALQQFGYVSRDVMAYVAERLEVPLSKVLAVASFYTMLNLEPVGRYHIQVCRTLSCALRGSEEILAHLEKRLGIKVGETTPDGKFTLSTVECLASCGTGPVVQINNDEYVESVTPEKIDAILDQLT